MKKPLIGILAMQGAVEPHVAHLEALGVAVIRVKKPADLQGIQGLILPGGESTTIIKLLKLFHIWEELPTLAKKIPFWGICAGAILMAREVENPKQESLGIMDFTVVRNAYGRQLESFVGEIEGLAGEALSAPAVFIRAPQFKNIGSGVVVAGKVHGEAVFLSEAQHMVTAFHPEMTNNNWCHEIFLERCIGGR